MITRDMALQFLSQMPDEAVLTAFSAATGMQHPQATGMDDPMFAGLSATSDPDNSVKGWSELKFDQGPDDRPALADKDYMINRLTAEQKAQQNGGPRGLGMPMDSAESAYGLGSG